MKKENTREGAGAGTMQIKYGSELTLSQRQVPKYWKLKVQLFLREIQEQISLDYMALLLSPAEGLWSCIEAARRDEFTEIRQGSLLLL